jgi:hypothetical protein
MELFRRFEQKIESALEGFFGRTFRGRIQPAELGHRLQREMEQEKVISPGSVFVPNHFGVFLHPDDCASLQPVLPIVVPELQRFLTDWAKERGFRLSAAVEISVEGDASVKVGTVKVNAALTKREEVNESLEPAGTVRATLTLTPNGQTFELSLPETGIGRDAQNEICLDHKSVSRSHARILYEDGQAVIYDVGSTNGTFVNGQPISRSVLRSGDVVRIGTILMTYKVVRVV